MATQRAIKVNVTIPLPEKDKQTLSPKAPCSACGKCGQQSQKTKDAIGQVAEILLMLASGQCPPDQVMDAGARIEALLRRYYSHQ